MTFSTLFSNFDRLAPNRPLWITTSDVVLTAKEIFDQVSFDTNAYRDRSVAVELADPLQFALAIVVLDGICDSFLLLPPNLTADDRQRLRDSFRPDQTFDESSMKNRSIASTPPSRPRQTKWVLATSGTTGTPKLVQHTLESLTRSASFDLTVGASHTWSSLYNLTGFAGLQVFLQAWCGGSRFVIPKLDAPIDQQIQRMSQHGVTALSATPTMWRKILMAAKVDHWPLQRVTLGGEIADQRILDAIANAFPQAKISQIYASTEAGVGFSVRDGRSGFPASYLENPPSGVELRVEQDRLFLRNPNSTQRFLDPTVSLHRNDGFIDTGDRVVRDGDRFYFLGRDNGSINVGGNKVFPEEVERVLLQHDAVADARVYAKKNSFTGSLVVADVVCKADIDTASVSKTLRDHCRNQLDAFKVPTSIRLVDQIETSATGKLKRSA